MSNQQAAESFVKAAKNEAWLLGSRVFILLFSATAAILSYFGTTTLNEIKTSIADVRRDVSTLDRRYSEDRVTMADRVGKVEGQVGQLNGSIETHRRRLDDMGADQRAVWQRLFEMGRQTPKSNNP